MINNNDNNNNKKFLGLFLMVCRNFGTWVQNWIRCWPNGFKCFYLPKLPRIEKSIFRQKCEQISKNTSSFFFFRKVS